MVKVQATSDRPQNRNITDIKSGQFYIVSREEYEANSDVMTFVEDVPDVEEALPAKPKAKAKK